jgi:dihydroorotate dehydrogenase (NAD+) catalytic subunit
VSHSLPRYDPTKTYRWNYDHAPEPTAVSVPAVSGRWNFCGLPVESPLGIAAGPLLNGKWCLTYAALGFDVLTYKTVRSAERACYPLPNLQPVSCENLSGDETRVTPAEQMHGSWAVSFGMPSSAPEIWRRDIEWTRANLSTTKVLCVSVVGTIQDGWTLDDLAEDYALCARWAVESGADCIETNFSCPNVSTCDGQLYQDAEQSRHVAKAVREAIGTVPLILKIGHLRTDESIAALLAGVGDLVDGLAMTNSIATTVGESASDLMFDRQLRGICGEAIRDASVSQTRRFAEAIQDRSLPIKLIGVGGIGTAADVRRYLDAGAHACHLATSAMINPAVGIEIRRNFSV